MKKDVEELRTWFLQTKRVFPWRKEPTPYRVWISEVMLQQTQAARVLFYFEKWMERFPTVEVLAEASEEEVLKMWEGLGYYSRARALLSAAKTIVHQFQGKFPDTEEELATLKGLGPYTVAAILAFAFHKKIAAVDANVIRVIARLFEIDEESTKPKVHKKITELANSLLPEKKSWEIAEALIELGAVICKARNPFCDLCPLKMSCKSFQNGTQSQFPVKTKKVKYEKLFRHVALITSSNHILLRRVAPGNVMAGLWEFPYAESCEKAIEGQEYALLLEKLGLRDAEFLQDLEEENHSYTRFRVTLYPKIFSFPERIAIFEHEWVSLSQVELLAFSSGHKRLLQKFVSIS